MESPMFEEILRVKYPEDDRNFIDNIDVGEFTSILLHKNVYSYLLLLIWNRLLQEGSVNFSQIVNTELFKWKPVQLGDGSIGLWEKVILGG